MFSGNKVKDAQFAKGGHTVLDRALEIQGYVRFSGTIDIEGVVNGDVIAVDESDALVRILEKGVVNGEVRAPRIIVNGGVSGDIYATKHLELAAKARVNGNVHYHEIEMVKGSQVNGSLVYIDQDAIDEQQKAAAASDQKSTKPVEA
ncbi:MAG: cytoskeletal protein CcmA (bactofilin family) [Flavobacteriales bacterium]